MIEKKYEHLIYYTICDILSTEVKKTNFSTLHNLCKTINTNITYGTALSTEEYKVLASLMSEVSYLYGLSDDDTVKYVNLFFKKELWVQYGDIIYVVKAHLKYFS